ncbi:MAG: hypothetical protein Q9163_001475 [Psora crenata]
MVLFVLGVLVVSASYLVYKYRYPSSPVSLEEKDLNAKTPRPASPAGAFRAEFQGDHIDGSHVVNCVDKSTDSTGARQTGNEFSSSALAITHLSSNLVTASQHELANGIGAKDFKGGGFSVYREHLTVSSVLPVNGKPKGSAPPSSSMLPPLRPRAIPPTPLTAIRPPPSAASNLRRPLDRSHAPSSSSLAPTSSTLAPSSRPSKKVLLKPGHSPLDWAHLTNCPPDPTFLRGADVPSHLIRVTPSLLKQHTGRKGKNAWGVYRGRVYNLSPYMDFHPGGVDQLMRAAGKEKEGERLFMEIHPWINWENMLGECLVGILVGEQEASVNQMDQMD